MYKVCESTVGTWDTISIEHEYLNAKIIENSDELVYVLYTGSRSMIKTAVKRLFCSKVCIYIYVYI